MHTSQDALDEATNAFRKGRVLPEWAAREIASWWHSGANENTYALSSAGKVLPDCTIEDFISPEEMEDLNEADTTAIYMLAGFIASEKAKRHLQYPHEFGHWSMCTECMRACYCTEHEPECVFCQAETESFA